MPLFSRFSRTLAALLLLCATVPAAAQVTYFPYVEDFDTNGGLLVQSTADDFDWTQLSGATQSNFTGPSGDHTTGSGSYIYTEATTNVNSTAIIESPYIDGSSISGVPYISFWYHMYGAYMGTLTLEIENGGSWTSVWSLSGDQTDQWFFASVDLSAYAGTTFRYRFVGATANDYRSDMALDDITVDGAVGCLPTYTNGSCSGGDFIDDFTFNGFTNLGSGCAVNTPNNYSDFSATHQFDVERDSTYTMVIGVGSYNEQIGVYVDWNNDGDFQDAAEFYAAGLATTTTPLSYNLTVPASAASGPVAMRITATYTTVPTQAGLCGTYSYGETEDYTLIVGCSPAFGNSCSSNDVIDGVQFAGISNLNTGCTGTVPDNFTDYTNLVGNVSQGGTETLSVTTGGWAERVGAWIDWNRDGDYEDSGEFYDVGVIAANTTGTANISVPANAVLGTTTMLVVAKFGGSNLTQGDLCGSFSYGEMEAYSVNVIAGGDLGVSGIASPVSDCQLGTENISVDVTNYGTTTQNNYTVAYQINGGAVVSGVSTNAIAPGQTLTLTFSTPVDFSTDGTYDLVAWTAVTADPDNTNDTTAVTVENYTSVDALPYTENFDAFPTDNSTFAPYAEPNPQAFPAGWEQQLGDGADWYGRSAGTGSTGTGPNSDHTSGTGTYVFVEDGSNNNTGVGLIRNCINLGTSGMVQMSYWVSSFNVGTSADNYLLVEVYHNGQWNLVDSLGSLTSLAWEERIVDLSAFSGYVSLRFSVNNSNSDYFHDIAIDDINISVQAINYFAAHPANTSTCDGSSAYFTVDVDNAYTATAYQWQVNTGSGWANCVDGAVYAGSTTDSLVIQSATSAMNSWQYQCVATISGPGNQTSNAGVLTVTANTASVNLGADTAICTGNSITLNAGSASSYLWSTGATSQSISVSSAGTYSVTVDDGSCTATDDLTLTINSLPTPSVADVTVCPGSNGNLNAGSYSGYLWSTGATIQTISASVAGSYTVTVTDNNGCTGTDSGVLGFHQAPTVDLGADQFVCGAGSTTLDAGGGFSAYLWSAGGTNQTLNVTSAGTYTVTVTDANTCTATDMVNVSFTSSLPVNLGNDTAICSGSSLTLDAAMGTSWLWSTGANTSTITVSASGTYAVTATTGGCNGTDSIVVTVNSLPVPSVADASVCPGVSHTFDAGSFGSYSWSTGASSQTITANSAGTYTVTVTDGNGCTAQDDATLTLYAQPTTSLGGSGNLCQGNSTTLDAGAGFTSYSWSGGTTGQTLLVDATGTYAVTVTDANGCTDSDSYMLTVNSLPNTNLGADVQLCDGESTTLDAGAGFASYVWSTMGTSQTVTVSTSTTVTVTVTDNNNCSNSDTVVVTVSPLPTINLGGDVAVCAGEAVTLDAGTGFAGYAWSTGDSVPQITTTTAGMYAVTVTSVDGCTASDAVTITQAPAMAVTGTVSPASCGASDGAAAVTVTGGATPYSYQWSNGATSPVNGPVAAGAYTVTITDGNGCTLTSQQIVGSTGAATLAFTTNDVSCPGAQDGSALVTATGGQAPYTYLWSNGITTAVQQGLSGGWYYVTVTGADGCVAVDGVEIVEADSMELSTVVTQSLCGQASGSVAVFVLGGTAPYNYSWSPGGQTGSTASGLGSGSYTVEVTDLAGCTAQATANVTDADGPSIDNLEITGPTCEGTADGTVAVFASGGTQPYTYAWTPFAETGAIVFNVGYVGPVSIVVTDASGCSSGASGTVSAANPAPTVSIGPDTVFCAGESVTFAVGSFASYLWHDGSTGSTVDVSEPETVWVQVTDVNGCMATDTALADTMTCVGLGEASGQVAVSVFPNPNRGAFTLRIDGAQASAVQLDVLNTLGQLVHTQQLQVSGAAHREQLMLNLPAGVYYLRMAGMDAMHLQRVIIE